jgi:hypothetical protein
MVNAIGGGSGSVSGSAAQEKMKQTQEDVLAAVAKELGETEADLQKGLASGKSLTDLAAAKGISQDDLKSTIAGVVQKDMPNASPDQVANITNRMAQVHGGGHHHGHHAPAVDASTAVAPVTTPDPATGSTVDIVA